MFGIGLPEIIVILAVALIVVGPDKLPELARSLAKGVQELKKTVNQVKENLNEETNILGDVQGELKKTVNQVKEDLNKEGNILGDVQGELKKTASGLQDHLLDTDTKTWQATAGESTDNDDEDEGVIDLQPLEERPWEKDRKKGPDPVAADDAATDAPVEVEGQETDNSTQPGKQPPVSTA